MSTTKSFSTETSDRYALALYEIACESSEIDNVEKSLKELAALYKTSDDLKKFIKNPTKSLEDQIKVVNQISEIMQFTKILKNFLSILATKRRIFFLNNIINSFLKLISKKKEIISASLISSKELSDNEIKKISEDLSKSISSKINFNYKIDQELIGGLKIQIGSIMIDSSIKNKLKKYEQLMLEN